MDNKTTSAMATISGLNLSPTQTAALVVELFHGLLIDGDAVSAAQPRQSRGRFSCKKLKVGATEDAQSQEYVMSQLEKGRSLGGSSSASASTPSSPPPANVRSPVGGAGAEGAANAGGAAVASVPPVEAALEEQALGDRIEGMMQSLSCADQVEVVEVAVACVFRNRKDKQGFRATMATLFSTLAKKLAEQERWEEENDEGKEGDEEGDGGRAGGVSGGGAAGLLTDVAGATVGVEVAGKRHKQNGAALSKGVRNAQERVRARGKIIQGLLAALAGVEVPAEGASGRAAMMDVMASPTKASSSSSSSSTRHGIETQGRWINELVEMEKYLERIWVQRMYNNMRH